MYSSTQLHLPDSYPPACMDRESLQPKVQKLPRLVSRQKGVFCLEQLPGNMAQPPLQLLLISPGTLVQFAEMTSPQQRRIETISRHITSSSPSRQRLSVEGQDCAAAPARLLEGQVPSCA